ncbi:MAG: hypothetical protein OEX08_00025 [Candidatus Nomurabacteria bacterium]|nr:hypothetical protein [Candidatus Nomurabacteria bacterium]
MWPFRTKKKESSFQIICDIGTSSVGVAFVNIKNPNKRPIVIEHKRVSFPIRDNTELLLDDMVRAFDQALASIFDQTSIPISRATCVLTGAWCDTDIIHINETNKEPTRVTKKTLDKMLRQSFQSKSGSLVDDTLIEHKIIQATVDGYLSDNPQGKKSKKLDLVVMATTAPEMITERLRNSIARFYNCPVDMMSFGYVSFRAHQEALFEYDDMLIFDVGGEVTDVMVIHDRAPVIIGAIPFGTHHMIRNIADKTHKSIRDVRSQLHIRSHGDGGQDDFDNVFEQEIALWYRHVSPVIEANHGYGCDVAVVVTDPEFGDGVRDILGERLIKENRQCRMVMRGPMRIIETNILYDDPEKRDQFLSLEVFVVNMIQ